MISTWREVDAGERKRPKAVRRNDVLNPERGGPSEVL